MRKYEVMFVLRPDLDDEKVTATIEKFSALIQGQGGTVGNIEKWGRRRLAYEIKGQREGYYVVVNFEGEPAVSSELDRVLKITDEVLRHLIVRKHAEPVQRRAAEAEQAAEQAERAEKSEKPEGTDEGSVK